MKGIESDTIGKEDYYLPGNGFTKQENHETSVLPIILLFSWLTILFGPIGGEKQNLTSFLLVEIKLFIKITKIFLMRFLFRFLFCFVK